MVANSSATGWIATGGLVAAVLASFLAVDVGGWDPVGPLRFLLIPTLAAVAVAAMAFGAREHGGRCRSPLGYVWVALLAWLGLASLFAVDPLHAWIGTPDRHFGFVTWVLLAAVWLATLQTGPTAHRWLVVATAVAAAASGAWAILELFDIAPIDRTFDGGRLGGPFAQPAYLGAAMALAFPVGLGVAIAAWSGRVDDRWPVAIVGLAGAVGGLFALVASQSRAAWVGTVVAGIAVAWRQRARGAHALARPAGRVALLVAAALAAITMIVTPVGTRIASLVDPAGIIDGRTDEWTVALRTLWTSPIVGHGPEGYRVVFGEHVDAAYAIEHGRTVITDRAHNGLLDVGVTAGLPGLLLYATLVGFVLAQAWRSLASDSPIEVGLASGVGAYFLAQFFLFPVAEIEVAAWILVGALFAIKAEPQTQMTAVRRPLLILAGAAAGLFGVAAVVAGVLDVAADRRIASATDALTRDDPTTALADADRARELRPDSIRYHFIGARIAERVVLPQGFSAALERLEDGLERSPRDPALTSEQAEDALDLARQTRDPDDLAQAQALAIAVATSDPNNVQNQLRLGIVLASTGDVEAAETALREAAWLGPSQGEARFNLAVLLMQEERFGEARIEAEATAAVEPQSAPDVAALIDEIDRRTGVATDG